MIRNNEKQINETAIKFANLFRDLHHLLPTYGLTEAELYEAMRKAIYILEGQL